MVLPLGYVESPLQQTSVQQPELAGEPYGPANGNEGDPHGRQLSFCLAFVSLPKSLCVVFSAVCSSWYTKAGLWTFTQSCNCHIPCPDIYPIPRNLPKFFWLWSPISPWPLTERSLPPDKRAIKQVNADKKIMPSFLDFTCYLPYSSSHLLCSLEPFLGL